MLGLWQYGWKLWLQLSGWLAAYHWKSSWRRLYPWCWWMRKWCHHLWKCRWRSWRARCRKNLCVLRKQWRLIWLCLWSWICFHIWLGFSNILNRPLRSLKYNWLFDNPTIDEDCDDIDECTETDPDLMHECSEYATCANNFGSYTCTCDAGYTDDRDGDGIGDTHGRVCWTIIVSVGPWENFIVKLHLRT